MITGESKSFNYGAKLDSSGYLHWTAPEAWSAKVLMAIASAGASNIKAVNSNSSGTSIGTVTTSGFVSGCTQWDTLTAEIIDGQAGEVYLMRDGNKEITILEVLITYDTGEEYPVTSITSTDSSPIEVGAGSTYELNYTLTTESGNETTDELTWSSNAPAVATVENGVVTAVSAGTANITLKANETVSYSWEIVVPVKNATSIELDEEAYTGFIGESFTLVETVLPEGASNVISWESNNTDVATVEDGFVSLVGEGEATITVSTDNGLSDTCVVTVSKVKTTSVEFDAEEMNVSVWDTFELKATVLPENTQDTTSYKSSDETVATIVDGVVTTLKEGEVTITCESGEFSDEVKLVVGKESSLSFTKGTDEAYAVNASTYHINGFRMNYNKSHSRGAQCGDVEFNVTKAGTITFKYYETGGDKGRMAKLSDSEGNVIAEGAANTTSGSTLITLEAFVNEGTYLFANYESAGTGASTLVNLESISFVEANEQLYYQYDNDAAPTAIRFIGTIEVADVTTINTITLSFKLDGNDANKTVNITKLYTSVANTFEAVEGTYYVCHAITGIGSALTHEFEVTMTVEYADETVVSVTRSFTLGE